MSADHVVVLDRGSVIEQGAPEVLLARGGVFHDMFRAADRLWDRQAA
jgi:ABC-type multidrug transport system fused ATPase/permease subunit